MLVWHFVGAIIIFPGSFVMFMFDIQSQLAIYIQKKQKQGQHIEILISYLEYRIRFSKDFNSLPFSLRHITSLHSFKKAAF